MNVGALQGGETGPAAKRAAILAAELDVNVPEGRGERISIIEKGVGCRAFAGSHGGIKFLQHFPLGCQLRKSS